MDGMKPKRIQRRERSIMFTDPMVVAIEDRRKSMTRRLIEPQPRFEVGEATVLHEGSYVSFFSKAVYEEDQYGYEGEISNPKGSPCEGLGLRGPYRGGMHLWIKQGVRCRNTKELQKGKNGGWLWPCFYNPDVGAMWFRDNCYYTAGSKEADGVLLNKMFMPKWAAHIWLEIVGVKVERVTKISEADAKAEGVEPVEWSEDHGGNPGDFTSYREGFREIWESIHGPDSWKPVWVWALTFRPVAPAGVGKGKAHG